MMHTLQALLACKVLAIEQFLIETTNYLSTLAHVQLLQKVL